MIPELLFRALLALAAATPSMLLNASPTPSTISVTIGFNDSPYAVCRTGPMDAAAPSISLQCLPAGELTATENKVSVAQSGLPIELGAASEDYTLSFASYGDDPVETSVQKGRPAGLHLWTPR